MKWSISALIFLFGITFLTAQNTFTESVYFDLDQHELAADAKSTLDQFVQDLQYLEGLEIILRANTDAQGSNFYNKKLGERRAHSVRQYLAKQKIASKTATVENFGEENPAYSNDEEGGRSKNRRVDIIVSTSSALTLDDLFEQWQQDQEQFYTIDGSKDVRLIGENGTNIWIPSGSLVLEDGNQPIGKIKLSLKEAYDFSTMLMSNLSTNADDKLLETGGKIYLEAEANGQQLKIKKGETLTIALPSKEFKEDMQLFTGAIDPHGDVANWELTDRSFESSMNEVLEMRPRPHRPMMLSRAHTEAGPPKPAKKQEPIEPTKPRKPSTDKQRFQPNFWQRLTWKEEKIQTQEQLSYEKALKQYEEKKEKYAGRVLNYEKAMKDYEDYLQRLSDWKKEIKMRRVTYEQVNKEAYEKQLKLYELAVEKWEEDRLEQLTNLGNYPITGNQALKVVSGYFTSITSLGWINCDRFQNNPAEEKMQLAVDDLDETEERIFVIFNETKSLLRTYKRGEQYLTNAIPKGESVTIIGLKFQDRKPMLAQLNTVSDPEMAYELDFKACTAKEMKAQLNTLN